MNFKNTHTTSIKVSFNDFGKLEMCVQTISNNQSTMSTPVVTKEVSNDSTHTLALDTLSKRRQRNRHRPRRNVTIIEPQTTQKANTKKTISATSVATTAVIAGTTSAVSGVGVVILQHIIGFSVFLAYSPTTALAQYATAQIAASMAGAIVSSTLVATIVNVAFGALVTISMIFVAVIIYNLFMSESREDELSIFQVFSHTISTVFRKIFA